MDHFWRAAKPGEDGHQNEQERRDGKREDETSEIGRQGPTEGERDHADRRRCVADPDEHQPELVER